MVPMDIFRLRTAAWLGATVAAAGLLGAAGCTSSGSSSPSASPGASSKGLAVSQIVFGTLLKHSFRPGGKGAARTEHLIQPDDIVTLGGHRHNATRPDGPASFPASKAQPHWTKRRLATEQPKQSLSVGSCRLKSGSVGSRNGSWHCTAPRPFGRPVAILILAEGHLSPCRLPHFCPRHDAAAENRGSCECGGHSSDSC